MEENVRKDNALFKEDEGIAKTDSGVISMKSENKGKSESMMTMKTDYGEVNEKKVANEDLPVKKKHTTGEGCSLFPIHFAGGRENRKFFHDCIMPR